MNLPEGKGLMDRMLQVTRMAVVCHGKERHGAGAQRRTSERTQMHERSRYQPCVHMETNPADPCITMGSWCVLVPILHGVLELARDHR